jgi:hypothetical protein
MATGATATGTYTTGTAGAVGTGCPTTMGVGGVEPPAIRTGSWAWLDAIKVKVPRRERSAVLIMIIRRVKPCFYSRQVRNGCLNSGQTSAPA